MAADLPGKKSGAARSFKSFLLPLFRLSSVLIVGEPTGKAIIPKWNKSSCAS